MSIASGRMWSQLGTSIDQIGRMALLREQQRKEEERQAAQDELAAQDRALRMAEVTARTGISFVPNGTALPNTGTAQSQSGKTLLPMAIPAGRRLPDLTAPEEDVDRAVRMGVVTQPPVAPPAASKPVALTAIARAIQGPTTGVGSVVGTAHGGQYIQTRRSEDQQAEDAKLKEADRDASALASQPGNNEFAGLPWREQLSVVGTPARFNAFAARANREDTEQARLQASRAAYELLHEMDPTRYAEYRAGLKYPELLPTEISSANAAGRAVAARAARRRPAGTGPGTAGNDAKAAQAALRAGNAQAGQTRQDLRMAAKTKSEYEGGEGWKATKIGSEPTSRLPNGTAVWPTPLQSEFTADSAAAVQRADSIGTALTEQQARNATLAAAATNLRRPAADTSGVRTSASADTTTARPKRSVTRDVYDRMLAAEPYPGYVAKHFVVSR